MQKPDSYHLNSDSSVRFACLGVHIPRPLTEIPQPDGFLVLLIQKVKLASHSHVSGVEGSYSVVPESC